MQSPARLRLGVGRTCPCFCRSLTDIVPDHALATTIIPLLVLSGMVFVLSILFGGAPERRLSGVLLFVLLTKSIYDHIFGPIIWTGTEYGRVVLDVLLLVVIIRLALRANRLYPLAIGAMQIITLVAYAACALLPTSGPIAHAIMDSWAFHAQLGIMALGLLCHIARKRCLGRDYPDWIEAPPAPANMA